MSQSIDSQRLVALVGVPNTGKTTLFNALTGLRQKVGNYPGVTVEKKTGILRTLHGEKIEIVDLPGTYSLIPNSPDEKITRDVLLGDQSGLTRPDSVICVVNASNLESHLNLVLNVLDTGLPVILVVNMIDLAEKNQIQIDLEKLKELLGGIPIIPCQANSGRGLVELKTTLSRHDLPAPGRLWHTNPEIESAVDFLSNSLAQTSLPHLQSHALFLLENASYRNAHSDQLSENTHKLAQKFAENLCAPHKDIGEMISKSRSAYARGMAQKTIHRAKGLTASTLTDKLDAILLHKVGGWVIFVLLFVLLFWGLFTCASVPMNWIDERVSHFGTWLSEKMTTEGPLKDLVVNGIVPGIGGIVIFLPQILILFFFLGILETTGYMARAAFLMDRIMRKAGLPGKAFIPMMSSYACAIPGVMSTRTIDNAHDRLITIMVAPWMSCSARLPVYAMMIMVIFPTEEVESWKKSLIMFGLYLLGTFGAFVAAKLLRACFVKEKPAPLLLELPVYQKIDWSFILRMLLSRAWAFLAQAGTFILGCSILLWALVAYPKSDNPQTQAAQSYMGKIGHAIEPIVKPLGYDWRIGTGIVASFAAREVFNSHMGVIFAVEDEDLDSKEGTTLLRNRFLDATWPDGRKLFTPSTCISLLIFYVFAMQCLATTAVVKRETSSWRWALGQIAGMALVAYSLAFLGRFIAQSFGIS